MAITERGRWANSTVDERGRRVFANGLNERGQKVFGLSAGTPTGTIGSTAFDLKQSLYSDSSIQTDTKQLIYNDSTTVYDTKLTIYQDSFFNADTFQEIIDGINGSTIFDVKLSFYADNAMNADLIHQYYQDGFKEVDLLQIISETIITKMSWRNETKETVSLWGPTTQPTTTWKDPDLTIVSFRDVK